MRPVIVITTSQRETGPGPASSKRQRPPRPEAFLLRSYLDAIDAAGGLPVLVAAVDGRHEELAAWALERADGVVISGGPVDLLPYHYGEEPRVPFDSVDEPRAHLELAMARGCMAAGIPLLGVCGGLQVMAVAAGGRLVQDLEIEWPDVIEHQQLTPPSQPWHAVQLEAGLVRDGFPSAQIKVNSTHRQAVADAGALRVTGWAPDGVVEAAELRGHPWCVGVQWHPEAIGAALYPELCGAARARRR
jgi:putative glutamine amidotransferase